MANGDDLLKQRVTQRPSNYSINRQSFYLFTLIEAIDTWIDRRLMSSLKTSPFFSLLADDFQVMSTQKELSIYRFVADGHCWTFRRALHGHAAQLIFGF